MALDGQSIIRITTEKGEIRYINSYLTESRTNPFSVKTISKIEHALGFPTLKASQHLKELYKKHIGKGICEVFLQINDRTYVLILD